MKHTQFLINLINEKKFQKIAEIGVYQGKNCRWILKQCKNITSFWAVDLFKAYNDPSFAMGRLNQEQWDQIYRRVCWDMYWFPQFRVVKGDSLDVAKFFVKPYFDFVYIDAQHDKASVIADVTAWRNTVVPGGYIGGHDYNRGWSKGHRVADAVNEMFKKEEINLGADGVWYVKL